MLLLLLLCQSDGPIAEQYNDFNRDIAISIAEQDFDRSALQRFQCAHNVSAER